MTRPTSTRTSFATSASGVVRTPADLDALPAVLASYRAGCAPAGLVALESASGPGEDGWRHTVLAAEPVLQIRAHRGVAEARDRAGVVQSSGPFGDVLDATFRAVPPPAPAGDEVDRAEQPGRFCGGAIGFIGYEHGGAYERVARPSYDDLGMPDAWLGVFDEWIEWRDGRAWHGRIATPWSGVGPERRPLTERLAEAAPATAASALDAQTSALPAVYAPFDVAGWPGVRGTHSPDTYAAAVAQLVEAICNGDLFQANLTQRFAVDVTGRPAAALYTRLRAALRPGFGAVLSVPRDATGNGAGEPWRILSASPERFLRVEVAPDGLRRVRTDPIKGTRPRGGTPADDAARAAELVASEKDRAENRMIVDLMRNDLSRICRPGSIDVPALLALRSYPAVHHLVSTVVGTLRDGTTWADVLAATFPGGSITGAPKVQAMHEISRHERVPRGPYTGAIGTIGFDGSAEFSIAIRTVTVRPDHVAFVGAGGGVVADSDPCGEYVESLTKAHALLNALRPDGTPALPDPHSMA